MDYCLELPINPVSFGQVSTSLLKEVRGRGLDPCIFLIGNNDLSTQKKDEEFEKWLTKNIIKAPRVHDRNNKAIKLWHLRIVSNKVVPDLGKPIKKTGSEL